ncbi:MAG TPA: hypothetical protein PKG77_06015 [Phycisphaerae bacterium]|nr:hypothetical protein [Phycisphaerae bacterium]HQL71996.1 hypothetical protein [Phycisphaerae bacterium]
MGSFISSLAGLAAAWVAVGGGGLLAHPLRSAVVVLAGLVAAVLGWPRQKLSWPHRGVLLAGVLAAGGLATSNQPAVAVWAVCVLLAVLSAAGRDEDKFPLHLAARATAILGVYRLAIEAIPWAWTAADKLAGGLSTAAGALSGGRLWTGPTFAGLDYLIVMAALLALARRERAFSTARLGVLAGAIVLGHLAYLALLAHLPGVVEGWVKALPVETVRGPAAHAPRQAFWPGLAKQAVPWNLPAVAGLIHLCLAGWLLAWSVRQEARQAATRFKPATAAIAAAACAALLPLAAVVSWPLSAGGLEGKKIVLFEKGFLNWEKPAFGKYGRVYTGMYGMMPDFLASLGARCQISSELSEADLADADVLAMFFPDKPWTPGQLDRVKNYVRRGGALLVLGEHTIRDEKTGGSARFNEVLEGTAMEVRFDSAEFEIGGWLHSYQTTAHPMTAGISDYRNEFGVVVGASVRADWPARPVLIGQWGFADPGDVRATRRALLGNRAYDSGEKLGDLVLAAEQPVGDGLIMAFGDTSGFTNGVNMGAHRFTARVFSYLANRPGTGHHPSRQVAGMMLAAALAVLVWLSGDWRMLAAAGLAGSLAFLAATSLNAEAWSGRLVPDGRRLAARTDPPPLPSGQAPCRHLAYVDTTHSSALSEESWRYNGTGGLALTLMRGGYLTLNLPACTSEYLDRCKLLVTIAPFQEYSPAEREAIGRFVRGGGILICMAGYDHSAGCRSLLEDFGLRIGFATCENSLVVEAGEDAREPISMGHFKAPYYDGGTYRAYVRFHAAWPVGCIGQADGAKALAYGRLYLDGLLKAEIDDPRQRSAARRPRDVPVILLRSVEKGQVVVVGDTHFAANRNLEWEGGQPFEGMYENADFWRSLMGRLEGRPWYPPRQISLYERTSPATQPATQPTVPATQPTQPAAKGGQP